MAREKGWNLLCKFFDNMGPIPHHMHQSDEARQAASAGRASPRATTSRRSTTRLDNNFPYTFMGLEPGTTKDEVRQCLENWNKGDNGILVLSRAYRLEPRHRLADRSRHAARARLARAPTSRRGAATCSPCSSRWSKAASCRGRCWSRTCRPRSITDLDYHHRQLDWDANVDPHFGESNTLLPEAGAPFAETEAGRLPRAVDRLRHARGTRRRN